jgi:hypothetical protein
LTQTPTPLILTLNGQGYPWVVVLFMVGIVIYQLAAGEIIGLRRGPWIRRDDKPGKYWKAFAIEAAVVIVFVCIGLLTLSP